MGSKGIFWVIAACAIPQSLVGQPISLHPDNPHYFFYKGEPTILITSGEHYGAVLNLDFDYSKYLDELKSKGLNLTRTFTGVYVEPAGAFKISNNTLAPPGDRFICPWKRTDQPGYANGGNKFDLSRWDEKYFDRLKDFLREAENRGIVVELALFCPFYEDKQWVLSPMNNSNNINGTGDIGRNDVYTLDKNGTLLQVQEALVRKIVGELRGFSNLIYEVCNEPYFGGVTMDWQHHIASIIAESERTFDSRHLISQNIANGSARIINPHPSVSVFNFHYASPPYTVAHNFHLNKVIGDNETGFDGNSDSTYRREGWEFILAGGGLYNNLDYSFTVGHEQGTFKYPPEQPGGGSTALRKQLGYLQKFISRFDFVHMKSDSTIVSSDISSAKPYVLAERGKQYAVYFFKGGHTGLELDLPEGTYNVAWMNPLTGEFTKPKSLKHEGAKAKFVSPSFGEDAALSIVNKNYKRQSK
ncbi:MAG TPA: putative collagen-binding domain-containing protein [Cyclobacteriaceae bacterium]|nr:putative collagen-binding domain-containing protein [Cyclobacteriaceae bacterium]